MRTILGITLALIALAATALAEPLLGIDATITETQADGSKDVFVAERVFVLSGGMTVIRYGGLEVAVTPVLQETNVTSRIVVTRHDGDDAHLLARPTIVSRLNQKAEIASGNLTVALTTTLKK